MHTHLGASPTGQSVSDFKKTRQRLHIFVLVLMALERKATKGTKPELVAKRLTVS